MDQRQWRAVHNAYECRLGEVTGGVTKGQQARDGGVAVVCGAIHYGLCTVVAVPPRMFQHSNEVIDYVVIAEKNNQVIGILF